MRRVPPADVLLLATVSLWALNFTVTRFVLTHGFQPLAYATVRYGLAALAFAALTLTLERTLGVSRRDLPLLLLAAVVGIWLNQVAFVSGLARTTASAAALIMGTLPIFTALTAWAVRLERLTRRLLAAGLVSLGGVALVALGSDGAVGTSLAGNLLVLATAATWAAYTVAVAPLMRRYSPFRISAFVLLAGWLPLALTGLPDVAEQDFGLRPLVWAALAFAVAGPLVLTNVLWFTAIDRVGPSRATLFTNLQPFLAALFALAILSERITAVQVAGGALIAGGILLSRPRAPAVAAVRE